MAINHSSETASGRLQLLHNAIESGGVRISLGEIAEILGRKSLALFLLVLAAPISFPLPFPPFLTLFFAVPMAVVAIHLIIGKHSLWLPQWVAHKSLPQSLLLALLGKAIPFLKKIEYLLHPSLAFMTHRGAEKIIGIAIFLFSLSVAIPLPLTNTVPSMGLFLIALGMLERDGRVVLLGLAVGIVGICILPFLILTGQAVFSEMMAAFAS